MKLDGKVAIVTGAASGIGAASVRRLAFEGVAVVAADIDEGRGKAVAQELVDQNRKVVFHGCDISASDSWTALVQTALTTFGRLDIVHNNAFAVTVVPTHEMTEEQWHRQLDVSLTAIFLSVRATIRELRKRNGVIINTSSVHAMMGFPGHGGYDAAKGGVCSFTRELAAEYAPEVRVNAIVPGGIMTPAWGERHEDIRKWELQTPARRLGHPDEIAAAVAFLASDDASYITGTSLVVDGGWSIVKVDPGFGADPPDRESAVVVD